ncbi:MAG: hypothetical protein R3E10_14205 [Gemmatimonadota bacterium]
MSERHSAPQRRPPFPRVTRWGVLGSLALVVTSLFGGADEAQAQTRDLSVSLGTVRTEAERAAMRIAVEYAKNLGDVFQIRSREGRSRIVDLSPVLTLETGEADAFNRVIAKISGNVIWVPDTTIAGVRTPCGTCFFHVLTLSGGIEADRAFDDVNVLAEAGWVPWYQNLAGARRGLLGQTSVGVFVQAGYRADLPDAALDSTSAARVPGTEEEPGSALLRLKTDFTLTSPISLVDFGGTGLALIGRATAWFDLANSALYHRVAGGLRIELGDGESFDFLYQDGSGAPNFNEGEQFSASLVIRF